MRCWQGDLTDLPVYQGPVDAIALHDCYSQLSDRRSALVKAALALKPGGLLAISGSGAPSREQLAKLTADLPLRWLEHGQASASLMLLQACCHACCSFRGCIFGLPCTADNFAHNPW